MRKATIWDTDEAVAELKKLHAEGLSANQIASRITFLFNTKTTRNAVIGKCTRLGLKSANPIRRSLNGRLSTKKRDRVDGAKTIFGNARKVRDGKSQTERVRDKIALGISRDDICRDMGISESDYWSAVSRLNVGVEHYDPFIDVARKALLDLDNSDCRWPVGDPQKEGFGFCAAPRRPGKPYCDGHLKRAERPLVQDSTVHGRAAAGEHPVDATREHNSKDSSNPMPVKENA